MKQFLFFMSITILLSLQRAKAETEPNNTAATANTLELNVTASGGLTGGDVDWYKITTTADGNLNFSISSSSNDRVNVWYYLYDADGVTMLSSGQTFNMGTPYVPISFSGAAAGIYYVMIRPGLGSSMFGISYKITADLTPAAGANDAEPDNSKDSAMALPLNGSGGGHLGYYNNGQRDTADWYRINTTATGLLRVTATSGNGSLIHTDLFRADGTTLIDSSTSPALAVASGDKLAAGTYYVKVSSAGNMYNTYTIANSFFTGGYPGDAEPNDRPYLAATVPANSNTTGRIGTRTGGARDKLDWFKINYTGAGDLSFIISQGTLKGGKTASLSFDVFKDTAKASIHSSISTAANRSVSLSGLAKGYYWLRFASHKAADSVSYSFSNSFIQVAVASITVVDYDTAASCAGTNFISMKVSSGSAPSTVQIYRFGLPYGDAVMVNSNEVKQFNNLPTGVYNATAYADGATGAAFSTSAWVNLEPVPAGLATTNVKATSATLSWTLIPCAAYYTVQYKVSSVKGWTGTQVDGGANSLAITGLKANTGYLWRMSASDTANGLVANGVFSNSASFTTASSLVAEVGSHEREGVSVTGTAMQKAALLSVSPNPASTFFTIHCSTANAQKLSAVLYDGNGRAVWNSGLLSADALNNKQVNAGGFANGVYYLRVNNAGGAVASNIKVIIVH